MHLKIYPQSLDAYRESKSLETFSAIGIPLMNSFSTEAIDLVSELFMETGVPHMVFFANAHTITLSSKLRDLRRVLNQATYVLPDGVGVQICSLLQGVKFKDNLCGTDFIPKLFFANADRDYSYYLLGGTETSVEKAAHASAAMFQGWNLVGYHHGYIDNKQSNEVLQTINMLNPDLLLVGMGNPLQEYWIANHRNKLNARVCIGVGGLFDFWSGHRRRAPKILRRFLLEWLYILMTEPHKKRRYLVGNFEFLMKILINSKKRDDQSNGE